MYRYLFLWCFFYSYKLLKIGKNRYIWKWARLFSLGLKKLSERAAKYTAEFRPYLSVLNQSATKRLQCRVLYWWFVTGSVSFIVLGEIPFSYLNTSAIREFKHRWCEEILLVKSRGSS